MSPLPTYPEIAASFLALAQPIADNDAAKPWANPGYASASNSLAKTINAAVTNNQRLVTQET